MLRDATRQKVGTTALTRAHFLLLYAAMLVAASGNTALQSVMPAIGREIGISDFWVAVAYTWSAVLWVALAPFWAEKSDHHGRKTLALLGLSGFIVSTLLCGMVLHLGLIGAIGGGLTFILFGIFRAIYGALGSATPSATQAYLAAKTRRGGRVAALSALSSSFGLGTIIGPAVAPLFVLPVVGLAGPMFAFALIAIAVFTSVLLWLPNDRYGRRIGHGAAMSYPSGASQPTGASVVAATSPRGKRLSWKDLRVRSWIMAGVAAGHAQAATLTCIGFFVIDRLSLEPHGSEASIAIVMMAGASATLAAQWGLIPRLNLKPQALIFSGCLGGRDRARRSHDRSRPLWNYLVVRAGFAWIRLHPAGLHRRCVACGPAGGARRRGGADHGSERHQLGGRAGPRHGALPRQPEPAVRDFVRAARCPGDLVPASASALLVI